MTLNRSNLLSRLCIRSAVFGAVAALSILLAGSVEAESITGISIPVNGADASSHPFDDQVWSVTAPPFPLNTNLGIGFLVNTSPLSLGVSPQ